MKNLWPSKPEEILVLGAESTVTFDQSINILFPEGLVSWKIQFPIGLVLQGHIYHNLRNDIIDAHPTMASSDRSLGDIPVLIYLPLLLAGPLWKILQFGKYQKSI